MEWQRCFKLVSGVNRYQPCAAVPLETRSRYSRDYIISRGFNQNKQLVFRRAVLFAFLSICTNDVCGKVISATVHCCEADRPQCGMQ